MVRRLKWMDEGEDGRAYVTSRDKAKAGKIIYPTTSMVSIIVSPHHLLAYQNIPVLSPSPLIRSANDKSGIRPLFLSYLQKVAYKAAEVKFRHAPR